MKRFATFLIIITLAATSVFASATEFLDNGVSSRAMALGNAYVGLSDDVDAIMFNSAGLAGIKSTQISSMQTKLYGDINQSYISAVIPAGNMGTIGFAYINAGVDGIFSTSRVSYEGEMRNQVSGTFSYGANAIMLGYGKEIMPNLSIGITAKSISEKLATNGASGFGADLGLMYQPQDNLKIGVNFFNVLAPTMKWDTASGQEEKLAMKTAVGVSYKMDNITLLTDITNSDVAGFGYGVGIEYNYNNLIDIRAGYGNDSMTFGAGVSYKGVKVSYAYVGSNDNVLENNQVFAIGFDFGAPKQKKSSNKDLKVNMDNATVVKPKSTDVTFDDIERHWSRNSVETVAGLGIVSGRPNGDFDPKGLIIKAEAAKLILSAYKLKKGSGRAEASVIVKNIDDNTSVNVEIINEYGSKVTEVQAQDTNKAEVKKIVWNGTDSEGTVVQDGVYTLKVDVVSEGKSISKEEPLHVTSKYVNIKLRDKTETDYADVLATHWASGIVSEASDLGLLKGETDMIYKPSKPVTRIQMILAVARALQLEGYKADPRTEIPYKDKYKLPQKYNDLLKTYITVLGAGGDQFGNLNPYALLTRAEATTLLNRYLNTNGVLKYTNSKTEQATTQVQEVASVTVPDVKLELSKTDTGMLVLRGTAVDTKEIHVNGKSIGIRAADKKFYTKTKYIENGAVQVAIVNESEGVYDITISTLKNKIIVRGLADEDVKVAVNGSTVYVKANGKFYKKLLTDETKLNLVIAPKNGKSALAGVEKK